MLNTIIAEALDDICTQLEESQKNGKDFNESLQVILQAIVKKHKRILFNGDNYTDAWHKEAEKRGLPNLKTTPEALESMMDKSTVDLFEKYGVLKKGELESRYEIYKEQYEKTILIEAQCAANMARTMIIPVTIEYQSELASTIANVKECGGEVKETVMLLKDVSGITGKALQYIKKLESSIDGGLSPEIISSMNDLRETVDALEGLVPDEIWPLPTYAEMMFDL